MTEGCARCGRCRAIAREMPNDAGPELRAAMIAHIDKVYGGCANVAEAKAVVNSASSFVWQRAPKQKWS